MRFPVLLALLPLVAACNGNGPGAPGAGGIALDRLADDGEGWTRELAVVLGGIDACLGHAGHKPAHVLRATEFEPGFTFVTLEERDQRIYTCIGRNDGGFVAEYRSLPAGANVAPGPVFTRYPDRPPGGGCMEAERVFGADGRQVGWLSFDVC